ncbi:MAG: hypothetical protein HY644_03530 [Acidobacteria bacterium]|nr:hypothetical protein [Acidobacteriota bacterium]
MAPQKDSEQAAAQEHSEHSPRHGGVFFMALDYQHHLEATLTAPDTFRIYLYDARMQPLGPSHVQETTATAYWGELPEPPGMPLTVSRDSRNLETTLGEKLKFPLTLTVLLRFPGKPSGEKPELFTFTFDHYSQGPDDSDNSLN